MRSVVVGLLGIVGSTLVLLAGVGILRFRDLYSRMHAATKATTVGMILICAAGAVGIDGGASKVLLAAALIVITAPAGAHLIGRAAYRAEGIDIALDGPDDLAEIVDETHDDR